MRLFSLIALAALSTSALSSVAQARDSMYINLQVASATTYAREGARSFKSRHATVTMSGRMSAVVNGQSVVQEIPSTTQSTSEDTGRIDIIGADQIRLVGTDNVTAIVVKARIGADGSIYASGRHLSRAMNSLLEPQLRAIKQQLGNQVNGDINVRARDLVCAPRGDGLHCTFGANLSLAVSQN
jgi:hypothetical protein